MKYAREVKENGSSSTNNFMLDDVMDTLNHFGISNEDPNNDELIKRLTIEKIEYARRCALQICLKGGGFSVELKESYTKTDNALQEKIIELGGKPVVTIFE